ncbi:diaminopimelate decarboxylase [Kroppenstedtia pulmonis]|uniref:Diaminopimelate decarboxylase n=1 Tax=Kroppenstedtia pulmonis TaxID=1380685 RepID=A0A7D4BS23_9BACL|nr:diaminopimelate decarboxylase [Kroppenstedtia pulmonis]QKG85951.1 diaminopimelate decarboxylase [Kroppenstedtia pulmonis]
MHLHGTSRINAAGHLEIGGCDTVDLVKRFGSPLYVVDEARVREQMRRYKQAFRETGFSSQVAYASKAFSTMAMCRIVEEEGLFLDVVSEGELFTALEAGFPPSRIYFHGNNKTLRELEMGLDADIYLFVLDNFVEMEMLQTLARSRGKKVRVLLRTTPGIEAHTHNYIQTGQEDSKFGFDLSSGQVLKAVKRVLSSNDLELEGFHCHIGSQIFEVDGFRMAIRKLGEFAEETRHVTGFTTRILNLGGGFGIRYNQNDQPLPIRDYVKAISEGVQESFPHHLPEIWLEPGRSIVGEAGTTLYTIGTVKEIPGVRKYVAVDGGMNDHPRTALYQASYEAILANRASAPCEETVSVAGKLCETGDMLIWDIPLPKVNNGDILAVSCTGAYHYSMSNNYNRVARPAVAFVQNGQADLVVRRETLADLIRNDRIPERLKAGESSSS